MSHKQNLLTIFMAIILLAFSSVYGDTLREEYREFKVEAKKELREIDKKIESLSKKIKQESIEAKKELKELYSNRAELDEKIKKFDDEAREEWKEAKAEIKKLASKIKTEVKSFLSKYD